MQRFQIKKNALTGVLFALLSFTTQAQRTIEVKYTEDASGRYQFTCTNRAFCTYILEIDFSQFDNVRSDLALPYRAEVKPGLNNLFKLTRINNDKATQFKYQVRQTKGCMHPHPDTGFVYLLPVSPGKETQAYEMQNNPPPPSADPLAPGGMTPQIVNWYVIRLRMKPGDTIYAARKGVVNEVEVSSGLNDAGASSGSSENYIEVFQSDCSFARYAVFKKDGAYVKPGQAIVPGQPLGIVGGDKFGRGSDIKFSVYYNQEELDGERRKTYWRYITIPFWTMYNGKGRLKHGATYTGEFAAAIMNQENARPATKKAPAKKKAK